MRLHPREQLSNRASLNIAVAVSDIWDKHDLDYGTILATLTTVQTHYLRQMTFVEGANSDLLLDPTQMHLPEVAAMALEIRTAIDQEALTLGETLRCINEQMASAIKYIIREERHPGNPDAPGGLAMP